MKHLPVLRASATTRWTNCTWFSGHTWPESPSSDAAEYGRHVHEGVACALGGVAFTPSSSSAATLIQAGYAYGMTLEGTKHIEHTLSWAGMEDSIQGTPDLYVVNGDTAILVDWKTGIRHGGYSDQMRTYAWLICQAHPDVLTVDVRLVYLAEGEVDSFTITHDDVLAHSQAIMVALSQRSEEPLKAVPGSWCEWCPAALDCPKNVAMAPALADAATVNVDVRLLATAVNTHDEAVLAHALINYSAEVLERIEANLKAYVRANGPVTTREGQQYRAIKSERTTLVSSPEAMGFIDEAGCASTIKPTASWTDIKKALKGSPDKLAVLEVSLRASNSLKTTEFETWKTT